MRCTVLTPAWVVSSLMRGDEPAGASWLSRQSWIAMVASTCWRMCGRTWVSELIPERALARS